MRGQASRTRSAQRKHAHKSTAPASARTFCKRASSKNANTAVPERDRPRASQSPTTHETRAKHGQSRDERPSEQNALSSAQSRRTKAQHQQAHVHTASEHRPRMPTPPCQSATGHARHNHQPHTRLERSTVSRVMRGQASRTRSAQRKHAHKSTAPASARTFCKRASSKNANTAVPERDRPRASQSPTTHETRAKHGQSRDERPSEQTALSSAQALAQKHSTSKRTYRLQASIVQECQHRRARARQATRVTITNHTRDSSEARSVA